MACHVCIRVHRHEARPAPTECRIEGLQDGLAARDPHGGCVPARPHRPPRVRVVAPPPSWGLGGLEPGTDCGTLLPPRAPPKCPQSTSLWGMGVSPAAVPHTAPMCGGWVGGGGGGRRFSLHTRPAPPPPPCGPSQFRRVAGWPVVMVALKAPGSFSFTFLFFRTNPHAALGSRVGRVNSVVQFVVPHLRTTKMISDAHPHMLGSDPPPPPTATHCQQVTHW